MVKLIASRFSELPRSQSSIRQVTQFKPKVPLEPETTTIYNSYPLLFSPSPCVSSFCSFEASSISYSFFLTSSTSSDDPPSSKLSPLCLYSLIQEQPFLVFVTVSSTPFFSCSLAILSFTITFLSTNTKMLTTRLKISELLFNVPAERLRELEA